ncbi:MAG: transposase [Chlorobi bacterium]|nr:transposase [Chlorobiota bacterium]
MEKHKELVEIMLPEGILNIFEFRGMAKTPHSYKVTLEEKNRSPKLPREYSTRKVKSKGFKDITINDFPVRGRKVLLRIRRRVWQIEGLKKLFKNDLSLTFQGTKLEKEFTAFLKAIN